jgi:hypothetical protein
MNEEIKNELLRRLDKARSLEKRIGDVERAEESLRHLIETGHAVDIQIKQAVADNAAWVHLRASANNIDGLHPSDLRDALVEMHQATVVKLHKLKQEYEEL